jgi:3-hydroxy acid dehydrogenase/malonic semialdehyde reductase
MIVLITGATAGFGAATARRFVREGALVVAAGRRADRLTELRAELGASVHPVVLDVRDRLAVETAIATLPPGFAEIDVLVNNAGLAAGLEPAQSARLDDWDAMVDTNIKDRGHVINLGSTAGDFPYPGGNVYGGTKAFVYQFSLNLRADLIGTAVRVTDVAPGMSGGTEFSNVRFRHDDAKAEAVYAGTTPLNADDIADAIYWVATRPAHVNVNFIQMMPVCQAFGPFAVARDESATATGKDTK